MFYNFQVKEKLLEQLKRHKDTKITAREKIEQKCEELKSHLLDAETKLVNAQTQNNHYLQQKHRLEITEIEQKLRDAESIKTITEDGNRKTMELENSLHTSKRQLEKLRKYKRKEEKKKKSLESQLAEESCSSPISSNKSNSIPNKEAEQKVNSSEEKNCDTPEENSNILDEKLEGLRHEIRNLRKTRELLLEQRCKFDTKTINMHTLDEAEERKLLQYEEAIEAIDLAIEYKNELMCGRSLEDLISNSHPDRVDQMLMDRLMKLNDQEMRALLYKYFDKVVELRSSSKKLEIQVIDMECHAESLMNKVQGLNHKLQQINLEAERRLISLQQQHEDKLHVVMRHLANEGQVVSTVVERSNQTALAIAGGSKHVDKSSFITRFTRYARHETVPRQLQVVGTPPQTKVTRQKNKLIIQQSNK